LTTVKRVRGEAMSTANCRLQDSRLLFRVGIRFQLGVKALNLI